MIDSKQLAKLFSLAKTANRCESLVSQFDDKGAAVLKAKVKGRVKIEFKEAGLENSLIQERLHRSYGL